MVLHKYGETAAFTAMENLIVGIFELYIFKGRRNLGRVRL